MKDILKEYTNIQMIYHAKALEMLSMAFRQLLEIDTESDLEEFRNTFADSRSHLGSQAAQAIVKSTGKRNNSYDNIFGGGGGGSSGPASPREALGKSGRRAKSSENVSSTNGQRREHTSAARQQQQQQQQQQQPQRRNNNNFNQGNLGGGSAPDLSNQRNINNSNNILRANNELAVEDLSTDDSEEEYDER